MISTSTTTINVTEYKSTYSFMKEETGIHFLNSNIFNFEITDKFIKNTPHMIDYISNQPKVFVCLDLSFYHFYHDHFGEFLYQYEIMPDAKYIIDISLVAKEKSLPSFLKMFFKFLND